MRLALSEVAFGTENATRDARNQLDEYAAEQVKKREAEETAARIKSLGAYANGPITFNIPTK